jgi:hypothetical protein
MSLTSDPWPKDLPLPRDHVFALGVISLNYGQLEGIFQYLFAEATGIGQAQAAALFQRLPNDQRRDILGQLLPLADFPSEIKDSVAHFAAAFKICADNRHALMHSRSGGVCPTGLVLDKTTRSGGMLTCKPTLIDLQQIADSMHAFSIFGAMLLGDMQSFVTYRAKGDMAMAARFALRDRPPLPTPLEWNSPVQA